MKINNCIIDIEKTDDFSKLVEDRIAEIKENQRDVKFNLNEYSFSSYSNYFSSDKPIQISGYPMFYLLLDDEKEIYVEFLNRVKTHIRNGEIDFQTLCDDVRDTVYTKIGATNSADDMQRIIKYKYSPNFVCSIKKFYGEDVSECSERAVLAHELFKFIGVESYYITSHITINKSQSFHNFDIVYDEGKGYVFDLACCPTKRLENGELERLPLVKELSKKEMDKLSIQKNDVQVVLDENVFDDITFKMSSGKEYTINYSANNTKQKNYDL